MVQLPELIKNAILALTKLPGVGEKTALRMVMSMTNWSATELASVGSSIKELAKLKLCQQCHMYADEELCSICQNEDRKSRGVLCIVENASDLMAIERSGHFRGLYHILGGVLNPLIGIGPEELKIDELLKKIFEQSFQEVILAINPSVEGDATCSYLKSLLETDQHKSAHASLKVERIGFGIPVGGSLEFLDSMTISKAFENRKAF